MLGMMLCALIGLVGLVAGGVTTLSGQSVDWSGVATVIASILAPLVTLSGVSVSAIAAHDAKVRSEAVRNGNVGSERKMENQSSG